MRLNRVRIAAALVFGVAVGFGAGIGTSFAAADCNGLLPPWIPPGPITDGPPPLTCHDGPPASPDYVCQTDYQKPGHHSTCENGTVVGGFCCNNGAAYWIVYPPKCNGGACARGAATQGAPFPVGKVQACEPRANNPPVGCNSD